MQRRKQPMRLCLGCGQQRPKRELVRVVRSPEGEVHLDPTGKANGRGAYICPDPSCLEKALRNQRLGHALEAALPPETVAALSARLAAPQ
ncbi:MAG: YlxR family protein [Thermaerobacter sp.]|nr:YlxR family protein [Thermaerobacter sp.]